MDELRAPKEVKDALKDFVRRVKKKLGDAEVYLFGSYARGDWLHDSDIDLIVVSSAFQKLSLGERYVLVRGLLSTEFSVELLLYTPEEFRRAEGGVLIQDAKEYWIKLL